MAGTLKIKDMPVDARPREAFMRSAAPERDIPDASLLAILIRTGQKGSSAIDLAHRLINHFGSATNLVDATWQQIVAAKVPGVGKVAAVQLAAAFALVKRNIRTSHRSFARSIATSDDVVRQVQSIETDVKNQGKATVKVNIDVGAPVIGKIDMPTHSSAMKELDRGRLLFYVKFDGGQGYLDLEAFRKVIDL